MASLGVPICQPVEFGTCDEGVYSIQSWIDSADTVGAIPHSLIEECELHDSR